MIQFYFLSILANILGGLSLAADHYDEKISGFSRIKQFFEGNPGIRVTVGIVAFLAGFLKLLSVTKGDVPVVGDLLPSLSGLLIGATMLIERYKEKTTVESGAIDVANKVLIKNKSIIGTVGVVVAALHFLLPGVLFL
ncbi:MAG: hypothetical protein CMN78_04705 [Spirochaetales bacterium]|nr:hypothetical protein [Spirochaetales bacterium]